MATSLLKNGAKAEIILRISRNMLPAEHHSSRKQIQVSMPKILQAIGQQRQAAKKVLPPRDIKFAAVAEQPSHKRRSLLTKLKIFDLDLVVRLSDYRYLTAELIQRDTHLVTQREKNNAMLDASILTTQRELRRTNI